MTSTPAAQRILAALCALLFLGGVLGIFVVDGGDDDSDLATSGGTTTTVAGGDQPGDGGAPAGGDTSTSAAPGGGPATTTGGAPVTTVPGPAPTSAPAPGGDPGPLTAPRVGEYRYTSSLDGKQSESQLKVEDEPGGGEVRRLFKQTGEDSEQQLSVAFRGDGAYVRNTLFTIAGNKIDCDWEPDIRNVATPLKDGASWAFDTKCTTTFNNERADFHLTGTNKVRAPQKVKIGGRDVDVWPIERTSHLVVDTKYQTQPIHFEQDSTGVDLFSPRVGLDVRSTATSTSTGPSGKGEEHKTERELVSLDPR